MPGSQCRAVPNKSTPVIIGTVTGTLYPINTAAWSKLKGARRFSEGILSIVIDRKEVMADVF